MTPCRAQWPPYGIVDYFGDPEAERVLVVWAPAARPSRPWLLNAHGERVGVVQSAAVPAVPG
jgi:hypothetical protein